MSVNFGGREKSSLPGMDKLLIWQREKDSNPHIRSQSPLCYLYTIPLNASAIIRIFLRLSRFFSMTFADYSSACSRASSSCRAFAR